MLGRAVQERIKRYILEHDLRGGDALPPETHIARDLGVSRPLVREAVKGLESLGIVESRPGKGLYVRAFSLDPILDNLAYSLLFERDSIVELLQVREQLEIGLLPTAIAALSPGQLDLLRGLVERMREKGEQGIALVEEDRFFHRTLSEAVGNHLLIKLLDVFWVVFSRSRDRAIRVDPAPGRTWRGHQRILDALVAGDVTAAQGAMVAHFADLHQRVRMATPRRHPQMASDISAVPQPSDDSHTAPGGIAS